MLNPSRYKILAIGKIRKDWIRKGLNSYMKRLPGLIITDLRDSNPHKEAKSIQAQLTNDAKLIVLTEEGKLLSSLSFAECLKQFGSQRLDFVIGGANGVAPGIKNAHWAAITLGERCSLRSRPPLTAKLLVLRVPTKIQYAWNRQSGWKQKNVHKK